MNTSIAAIYASAPAVILATIRRCAVSIGAWYLAQRDYHLLCRMDESALRDLGLNSSDLRDATAVGIFGDPTCILARRADERHRRPNR